MATESSAPAPVIESVPSPTSGCEPKTTEARRTALAVARLSRQAELAMAEVELTLSQYRVLAVLDQGCEASSKLAEKLAVSRPSVTGVVDGLVVKGLVRRNQGDLDERRGERVNELLSELRP
jgi:DNA-binding MarR family transcriptional regulator